ncbi:Guanine nucleotide exchange factor (GEF) which may activate RAB8A and RAB8B [Actinomortierella ambigua]|uniref:Guanine nucleotide exchange factor (GEF) which may activate RAB8A and RAB8B n=1 Tax=Actinomortierella ambigua TaxID=1343610 RepID=A0A9P6PSH5_9FUNG|nr:Guanine nucleotide exchange factor (GEF) which may activate RAB8A and RAB8B [Actinomortierella ambigua]
MTEAPIHPPPEPVSKDVTAKDIANLYSRIHNLIETVKEPQQKAAAALAAPTPTEASANGTEGDAATTSETNGHPATAPPKYELADGECPCHAVVSTFTSRTCGICDRVLPSLAEAHNERTLLLEDLEQTNVRLVEEQKRASKEKIDNEVLRKKVEDLEDALDARTDDFLRVQRDLSIMNDKYVDEIDKVAELQHAKEMVESELEELSRTLFEEANGMVASEARARHQLELTRKHLEMELKDARDRLAAETSQLKELKAKMEAVMESSEPNSKRTSTDPSARPSVDLAQLFGVNNKMAVPNQQDQTAIAIDGNLIHEFKEFVAQASSVRLAKIHTLPFMRHCQDEDVEPCLRFGANPRISARKLTEGICSNTCFIEEATAEQVKEYERMVAAAQQPPSPARNSTSSKSQLWDRLQAQYAIYQAPKGGCQTCGRSGPLTHRYRIATTDEWSFIDRFCRDRLVAVCEFYIFIRNIRAGLYSTRTIEDLYSESLRLRLQMFYARLGVLPIMLREIGMQSQSSIGIMGPAGETQSVPHNAPSPSSRSSLASSSSSDLRAGSSDVVVATESASAVESTTATTTITSSTTATTTTTAIVTEKALVDSTVTTDATPSSSHTTTSLASAGPESTNPWTAEETEEKEKTEKAEEKEETETK